MFQREGCEISQFIYYRSLHTYTVLENNTKLLEFEACVTLYT